MHGRAGKEGLVGLGQEVPMHLPDRLARFSAAFLQSTLFQMELQRWVASGGRKQRVELICQACQLGAGLYRVDSGRNCMLESVMLSVGSGPKSQEGEGSPKPSWPPGKAVCATPTPSPGPVRGRHPEDRSHHIRSGNGLAHGIRWLGSSWCRPLPRPLAVAWCLMNGIAVLIKLIFLLSLVPQL